MGMSTFDDPFDADRKLSRLAASAASIDPRPNTTATLTLRCEPAPTRREALRGRRRLRRDARDVSEGRRAARVPEIGRRFDRAGRALADSFRSRPRPMSSRKPAHAGKDQAQGRLHPDHLRDADHHGAPLGFYSKQDLNVDVVKTAGWAVIRDKTINKEYDAAHMLAPMPIAISLGLGSNAIPFTVPAIENINGQAISLAMKHKDRRDPKNWKGMKFAIPFDYSMHNYLLRYYLAEHGIDPDQRRAAAFGAAAGNGRQSARRQRRRLPRARQHRAARGLRRRRLHAHPLEGNVGRPSLLLASRASRSSSRRSPNTYAALLRAIMEASAYSSKPEHRKQIAEAIAPANYINAPVTVLDQVLTGTYADGLGGIKKDPKRVDFDPFPYESPSRSGS